MSTKPSIMDIFNEMSYKNDEAGDELYYYSGILQEEPDITTAICLATGTKRREDSSEATLHQRALLLLEIGRKLSEEGKRLPKRQYFQEKDYSLLIDFFNYYSSLCYKLDVNWKPCRCVLIVLSSDVPFSILGAIIAAAFGAGCPVIVSYSIEDPWFLFYLKDVFSQTTLPQYFFHFLPNRESNKQYLELSAREKIVFLGSHLSTRSLYERSYFSSFSFLNPNNTATIILEFCDLDTAIDKIFYYTWNERLATMWGVSTAVVQESVYQKFLDRLKSRIDQLTDEQERALIKNRIIPVEDQHRETEPNTSVLKVLSCRTASEGINFLNSYQYYLGTSIWSENSSQALEIASKLICKNVWINSHGIIEPSVPFQSSDNHGKVVFGGYEGILEYLDIYETDFSESLFYEKKSNFNEKIREKEIISSAQKAFKEWSLTENKGMYLTKIAESLKNEHMPDSSTTVGVVLSAENTNTISRSCNRNFYTIHEKFPVGVIAMIFEHFDLRLLMHSITTAIASGNAVVVAVKSENSPLVKNLVDVFNAHLPRGLLNVIIEEEHTWLATNTGIQAVWLFITSSEDSLINVIKGASSISSKRFWLITKLPQNSHLLSIIYQKQCLSNKIIWLTKVDRFP